MSKSLVQSVEDKNADFHFRDKGRKMAYNKSTRKFKRCGNLELEFDIFRMLWNCRKIALTSFYISENC